jgi:hypothetical protein
MMSVLDDLWPEPRPKMWQKFDTEGIVHKEFVHQGRRWMENSIATVWGDCGKTSGVSTPGPCIMTTPRLTCRSFGSSFWLLRILQSFPTLPTHWASSPIYFPIPEDEIEAQEATVWLHWRDPDRIPGRDEDADAKWLPVVLPIMEIPQGSLCQCRRGLLRMEWKRIEISVRG